MNWRLAIAALVLGLLGWLLLLPVAVDPVAWQAPADRGYVDPFAINDRLARATGIPLGGDFHGPEDATLGHDGALYVTTEGGAVLRVRGSDVAPFATPGGRPLGIETAADGRLLVANAYDGLQRIGRDGSVTTLVDSVDGAPLVYANSLAIAADGRIYFTEASRKFGAREFGGTYPASLLDILEHGGHGRVFVHDPESGTTQTLLDDLNFANGIAVSDAGDYLLIAETGSYRILKHWLAGADAGTTESCSTTCRAFPIISRTGCRGASGSGSSRRATHCSIACRPARSCARSCSDCRAGCARPLRPRRTSSQSTVTARC